MHFVYIVTYLVNMLVLECEINSLDFLIVYIKKYLADNINSEAIIRKFQNMKICVRKF